MRNGFVEYALTVPGKDIDVNAGGRIGWAVRWTVLHLAVNGGHRDIVERLLMVPVIDVNVVGGAGAETARQLALRRGFREIAGLFDLVRAECGITTKDVSLSDKFLKIRFFRGRS